MTQRSEPKVSWANDVVYWYSQLQQGKEVPEEMRSRVNELRQHLSAKGAARFLCGVAGGGADCLVPLPEKRTPVPKGIATKARAEILPALSALLEALRARQERRKRGQTKKTEAQERQAARDAKKQQASEKKRERELAAAGKAAAVAPAHNKKSKRAASKPPAETLPTKLETLEHNRQPASGRKPRKETALPQKRTAVSGPKGSAVDLDALINEYAAQIDPAELAKAA